jgi:hypothetical protein
MRTFFANRQKVYLYLITGLVLLLIYGLFIFLYHTSYSNIPRPFHVFTYNLDKYYQLVYWFLIPFILISALAGQVYNIPVNIRIRINSYRQSLCFYYIQMSFVALWGTFLIGIITFVCFPLASKLVTINDCLHIFLLLIFCYLNFTNIGLLLIVLAKKFSEQISFFLVLLIALCDQYLFGHLIFKSTKLLYTPVFSFLEIIAALFENIFLMIGFLVLLSNQLKKKEE